MLGSQNAKMQPNLLANTVQEEQAKRKQQAKVFKDRTNRNRGVRRWKNHEVEVEKEKQEKIDEMQNKQNIFLNCDWNLDDDQESEVNNEQIDNLAQIYKDMKPKNKKSDKSKQRSSFLLALSSDEQEEEPTSDKKPSNQTIAQTPKQQQQRSSKKIVQPSFEPNNSNQFLFNLDENCSSSENQHSSDQQQQQAYISKNQSILPLSSLISEHKEQYYIQAIPHNKVFQCVMKRQKSQLTIRYHLYDSLTLRNFMTIVKGDDYLIISKYDSASVKNFNSQKKKDRIVGRVSSNFFGTEFDCSLQNSLYKGRNQDIPIPSKKQRVITIEYETNLFGLRGPRKMTIFAGQGFYYSPLNEIYSKQKGLKNKTVKKYCNKIPKWCSETGSYVLNFYGRATVSSIKNFIIVGEEEGQQAIPRVLFGKFGKQLFNLDIRYPFSIIQGVALAISSFDKKLACQ